MSIILDALKKAEKEKMGKLGETPREGQQFIVESPNKSSSLNTLILAGLAALSLVFLLYARLHHTTLVNAVPQPNFLTTSVAGTVPTDSDPEMQKAKQAYEEGRFAEARQIFEKLVLVRSTDAEVYNNLGLTLKKMGEKKGAADAYQKSLLLNSNYVEAHNNLAVLLIGDRRWEEAKQHLQQAVTLQPTYPEAHFNLGLTLEQLGDEKGALGAYKEFLALSPSLNIDLKTKIEQRLALLGRY